MSCPPTKKEGLLDSYRCTFWWYHVGCPCLWLVAGWWFGEPAARVSLSFSQDPSTTPIYSCGQDREIWSSKVNETSLFFLLVYFRVTLKAFRFISVSSKTETKLASHINIFNNIHLETILAKFQLRFGHILTMLVPFLITFLTQLKLKGLWSHLMTKSTLFL